VRVKEASETIESCVPERTWSSGIHSDGAAWYGVEMRGDAWRCVEMRGLLCERRSNAPIQLSSPRQEAMVVVVVVVVVVARQEGGLVDLGRLPEHTGRGVAMGGLRATGRLVTPPWTPRGWEHRREGGCRKYAMGRGACRMVIRRCCPPDLFGSCRRR
jgi:hypothetical protein